MKTTLRRILKYTPAVVMALLVAIWIPSEFWRFGISVLWADTVYGVEIKESNFGFHSAVGIDRLWYDRIYVEEIEPGTPQLSPLESDLAAPALFDPGTFTEEPQYPPRLASFLGDPYWYFGRGFLIDLPILCCLTALAPLTVGAFTGFRFRLWHYLAYTAIVAVELA